jgi:senataxin
VANPQLSRLLKSYHQDAHWFCPKRSAEDYHDYSNPDEAEDDDEEGEGISVAEKHQAIKEGEQRSRVAFAASLVVGAGEFAPPGFHEYYIQKLDTLFQSCDACVRRWHIGRKGYLKELAE